MCAEIEMGEEPTGLKNKDMWTSTVRKSCSTVHCETRSIY